MGTSSSRKGIHDAFVGYTDPTNEFMSNDQDEVGSSGFDVVFISDNESVDGAPRRPSPPPTPAPTLVPALNMETSDISGEHREHPFFGNMTFGPPTMVPITILLLYGAPSV